jgi:hypothetical protein
MLDVVTELVGGRWCIPYQRSGHFSALNQKMHGVVCRRRYGLRGWVLLFILESNLGGVGPEGVFRWEEEGGGVRRTGVARNILRGARNILLFHTKGVWSMEPVSDFCLCKEQLKDIIFFWT